MIQDRNRSTSTKYPAGSRTMKALMPSPGSTKGSRSTVTEPTDAALTYWNQRSTRVDAPSSGVTAVESGGGPSTTSESITVSPRALAGMGCCTALDRPALTMPMLLVLVPSAPTR
eukprot:scaffold647_cov411-Prasinococcus_capsulatus_cf.AAC.8